MSRVGRFITMQKMPRLNTWLGIFKGQMISLKTLTSSSTNQQEYQTIASVKQKLIEKLKAEPTFAQQSLKSREDLLKYLPKSQKDLPIRKMKDSFDSAIIPLSTNLELREKYTTVQGTVRVGRLMEDLDLIAVWCTTKHLSADPPLANDLFPYTIVTIHVDEIEVFSNKSQTTFDIRLSGHVCWVGKSSLEVSVWVDQFVGGKWNRTLRALILMAARNSTNNGPALVNLIEGETIEEKALLQRGEERRKKRLRILQESLLTTVPSTEELSLIHKLFIKTVDPLDVFLRNRVLPPNSKWMHDATLSTHVLCHPEHRNLHNKIFGGFLIRQALELSYILAVTYGNAPSKIIHISDITFYSPVDVGSLLKMYALVTFTETKYIQVFVYAETYDMINSTRKSTNSFNFTYEVLGPIDQVYPSTYLEAMKFIDGRRHFLQVKSRSESNLK